MVPFRFWKKIYTFYLNIDTVLWYLSAYQYFSWIPTAWCQLCLDLRELWKFLQFNLLYNVTFLFFIKLDKHQEVWEFVAGKKAENTDDWSVWVWTWLCFVI